MEVSSPSSYSDGYVPAGLKRFMMECWLIPPRLHLTEGRIGPLNAQPVHSRIADNPLRRARVVKPDVVANHGDARYSNPQGGSQDERWGARRALHAWVPSCHIVCRFSSKPSRRIPTTASQTVWQAQDPCGCGDVGRIRGGVAAGQVLRETARSRGSEW